jgi:hypothetical protein
MTIVERQELADALERIEKRFAKSDEDADLFRKEVRADVSAIKDDISRIKGMARLATWFVGAIGALGIIATALVQIGSR